MDKIDRMADAARRAFFRSPKHRREMLPWNDAPKGTRQIWRQVARAVLSVYETDKL